MKEILLVEDNIELAELMQAFLKKEGLAVQHVPSGEEAIVYLQNDPVKIVLLDIMLPGLDGFGVCRAIRETGNVPILILSAKSGKEDKLMGFELGADDYMEKPIDPEILLAKVRALLKRTYEAEVKEELIVSGEITIDVKARKVYLGKQELELNVKEFDLLKLFALNPQKTLHKDYLFRQIWGADSFSESQTLTVHVQMLRAKIEDNKRAPKRIQTVWGVGYRYEEI